VGAAGFDEYARLVASLLVDLSAPLQAIVNAHSELEEGQWRWMTLNELLALDWNAQVQNDVS
jgi:hypothetical protein